MPNTTSSTRNADAEKLCVDGRKHFLMLYSQRRDLKTMRVIEIWFCTKCGKFFDAKGNPI